MVDIKPFGPSCILSEAPHWDYNAQVLYYIDMYDARVIKYNPKTEEISSVKIDGEFVSIVIPIEGKKDQFIITVDRNLAILTWDGKSSTPTKVEYIATVDTEGEKPQFSVFNDGKVDPTGRLWVGTRTRIEETFLKPGIGSLYSFSKDGTPVVHLENITCSNGMAWSKDMKKMHYIDSPDAKVYVFDFNAQKEQSVSDTNKQTAFDFKATGTKGSPDGMTIDADDKLWIACFMGGQVVRVDPSTGTVLSRIEMPVSLVTCATFGGANLDELYITTAHVGMSEEDRKKNPQSGQVFRVTGLGVKGTRSSYAKF